MYLRRWGSSFEEVILFDEEIETAFFSLMAGQSPGFNETNYGIVNQFLTPY